ncbi:unnamed protein product [Cuscuta campestris]|uniref:BURP domain-containing protein n=1 Tax=Cuscuta campestris TaxID=132261 RepID=A0A484NNA2_9ASTE|nr:unnamed protein product [Cuscuta campestris]
MEFHLTIKTLTFLWIAVAASHAALSSSSSPIVSYWNSELPNTPMPQAIENSLSQTPTEWLEEKGTSVAVGKGGVNVNTGKGKPAGGGTTVNVGKGGVGVNTGAKPGQGTNVGVGKGGVNVHAGTKSGQGTNVGVGKGGVSVNAGGKSGQGTNVGVGKGGVSVHTGKGTNVAVGKGGVNVHAGKGTNVGVGKGGVSVGTGGKHGKPAGVRVGEGSPFAYNYAASADQLNDDPNVAVFFKPSALRNGARMTLHFTKTTNDAVFLPRSLSEKIPFSSEKIPEILRRFSVQPDSDEARSMTQTIKECEDPTVKGEEKKCVTSLESMVDFSKSTLIPGNKNRMTLTTLRAVSTESAGEASSVRQTYVVSGVHKIMHVGNGLMACHKLKYGYAVFNCHKTTTTEAFTVSLVGENGAKVEAAAICHKDTAAWNPNHMAFRALKVRPGTVPVCHFLPEDHIVWVATN